MEDEANCFARNVVAPIHIIDEFTFCLNEDYISRHFGITRNAAKTRLKFINNDRYYSKDTDKYELIYNCIEFLGSKEAPFLLGSIYHSIVNDIDALKSEQDKHYDGLYFNY